MERVSTLHTRKRLRGADCGATGTGLLRRADRFRSPVPIPGRNGTTPARDYGRSSKPTVYALGNRDFWRDCGEERYTIRDQIPRGRDRTAALGITLLMDAAAAIAGTRILGGTLWTDSRLRSFNLTRDFRTAQGCDGMVDYRRIRTGPRPRDRIEPEEILAMQRTTRAFIEAELAWVHDRPTVVGTHYAPHLHSIPDQHAHLAWCDASDLTDLFGACRPDLWVHGHVPRHADRRIGRSRVVCNPRGHVEKAAAFVPDLVVPVS